MDVQQCKLTVSKKKILFLKSGTKNTHATHEMMKYDNIKCLGVYISFPFIDTSIRNDQLCGSIQSSMINVPKLYGP